MRKQHLAGLAYAARDPTRVASEQWMALAFAGHPYGRPANGTPKTVADIGARGSGRLPRARASPRTTCGWWWSATSTRPTLGKLLDDVFGALPAKATLSPIAKTEVKGREKLKVIDMNVPQSVARFGLPAMGRSDKDFMPAFVLNTILGGSAFTSRLYQEVREKRGLAYGIDTSIVPMRHASMFFGGVATKNEEVGQSLDVIRSELKRIADDGPTEKELADTKAYLTGSFALRFDTSANIANQLLWMMVEGLGHGYIETRNAQIEAVTIDDVRRVAKRLFDGKDLLVIVVGRSVGRARRALRTPCGGLKAGSSNRATHDCVLSRASGRGSRPSVQGRRLGPREVAGGRPPGAWLRGVRKPPFAEPGGCQGEGDGGCRQRMLYAWSLLPLRPPEGRRWAAPLQRSSARFDPSWRDRPASLCTNFSAYGAPPASHPAHRSAVGADDRRPKSRYAPTGDDTAGAPVQAVDRRLPRGRHRRHGLSEAELARWLERLAPAIARLQDDYRSRRLPHLRIPEETADIAEAEAAFARLAQGARAVIFFGTGGSSLGGQTLAQLGGWHIPGTADEAQRKRPRTRFYDNLDGHTLASALHSFDDLGDGALRRHLQVGRHAGDAGAGAGGAGGREGGGPGEAHPGAVPRRHRAQGRGQAQRPAHAVRAARHSPASTITRASAGASRC